MRELALQSEKKSGDIRRKASSPSIRRVSLWANDGSGGMTPAQRMQAKLRIGPAGDKYEREADWVAEDMMRQSPLGLRHLLPGKYEIRQNCAACESSGSLCTKCSEEKQIRMKPVSSPSFSTKIQFKTRENTGTSAEMLSHRGVETTPPIAAGIESLRGGGQPLPENIRKSYETYFGCDFSRVRVHTGSRAAETAGAIQARAFAIGRDIVFARGEYEPETLRGRKLLAHEAAHVVQQTGHTIYRQPAPNPQTTSPASVPLPDEVIIDLIEGLEAKLPKISDHDEKAKTARQILFLNAELDRLEDPFYAQQIEDEYGDHIEDYANILDDMENILSSEEKTFRFLTGNEPTTGNLLATITYTSYVFAFPKLTQQIVLPLAKIPDSLAAFDISSEKSDYTDSVKRLPEFIFDDGYPVSYKKSLHLVNYRQIKKLPYRNFYLLPGNRPRYASDFDPFIMPEEKGEYQGEFASYYRAWTNFAIVSYTQALRKTWENRLIGLGYDIKSGKFNQISLQGLQQFRAKYPQGLDSEDDLLSLSIKFSDLTSSIDNLDIWRFFLALKFYGLSNASKEVMGILEREEHDFHWIYQLWADKKLQQLKPGQKFDKAIGWTLDKGWAQKNLKQFIDNIDDLLLQMLKERAKESVIKKVISFVASLHPIGRIAAIAYQIYETTGDVKDALDIVEKIYAIKEAVTHAREAFTVEQEQRAAAEIALVTVNILPDLLSKLVEIGAKKAMNRRKHVEESADVKEVKDLSDAQFNAEFETALRSRANKPANPHFDVEIVLPNGHRWKRNKKTGSWCRASEDCFPAYLNPDLTRELDQYADKYVRESDIYNEEVYPSLLDDPRLHQTSKGNFGEVVSDHMMQKGYETMVGITRTENADRGPGIDNVWKPFDQTHFDYTISETKFITGYEHKSLSDVRLGWTRSGRQTSDSWISGRDFRTNRFRLDEAVGAVEAARIRQALANNRVERLLIVVDETGRTWTYEVDSSGKPFRLKTD
ncbi:MAG: DUF4157 domain-containing protein [Calditrichia bacterium]